MCAVHCVRIGWPCCPPPQLSVGDEDFSLRLLTTVLNNCLHDPRVVAPLLDTAVPRGLSRMQALAAGSETVGLSYDLRLSCDNHDPLPLALSKLTC